MNVWIVLTPAALSALGLAAFGSAEHPRAAGCCEACPPDCCGDCPEEGCPPGCCEECGPDCCTERPGAE